MPEPLVAADAAPAARADTYWLLPLLAYSLMRTFLPLPSLAYSFLVIGGENIGIAPASWLGPFWLVSDYFRASCYIAIHANTV